MEQQNKVKSNQICLFEHFTTQKIKDNNLEKKFYVLTRTPLSSQIHYLAFNVRASKLKAIQKPAELIDLYSKDVEDE